MALVRLALTVLTFLLLMSGCASSAQRDIVRALNEVGCGGAPAVEYQPLMNRVVLSVSVQECVVAHPRRAGELVGRAEAARAMGRAIWSTPTYRFDSVLVTVYRTAEDPDRTRPQSAEIARDQLAAELGPRSPALESRDAPGDGGRAAWTFIPLAAGAVGLMLFVGLARAIRTGRVALVWIIGR